MMAGHGDPPLPCSLRSVLRFALILLTFVQLINVKVTAVSVSTVLLQPESPYLEAPVLFNSQSKNHQRSKTRISGSKTKNSHKKNKFERDSTAVKKKGKARKQKRHPPNEKRRTKLHQRTRQQDNKVEFFLFHATLASSPC